MDVIHVHANASIVCRCRAVEIFDCSGVTKIKGVFITTGTFSFVPSQRFRQQTHSLSLPEYSEPHFGALNHFTAPPLQDTVNSMPALILFSTSEVVPCMLLVTDKWFSMEQTHTAMYKRNLIWNMPE